MTMSNSESSNSSSSLLSARQNAKEAIDFQPTNPTSIAIWFLCSVRSERNGLVHIDEILKELNELLSNASSQNISDDSLLSSFSMMARSCHDTYEGERAKRSLRVSEASELFEHPQGQPLGISNTP